MVSITRRRQAASYIMIQRVNAQLSNLHRIIEVGDTQCVNNLRMNRTAFGRLCYLLTNLGGLVESRYARVEEKVAMFLSILAHHKKNRVAGHDYIRSGQTVSAHFHDVLKALLKLHPLLLVKSSHVDEDCRNEAWKCFKWFDDIKVTYTLLAGLPCALDGTHIGVHVPCRDKARYRNQKGAIAVNVLGQDFTPIIVVEKICQRSQYWCYENAGSYYLCDNGYTNVEGFLTPYRRVSIIAMLGQSCLRWEILRSPSFYPLKVHNHIILAFILLQNFIRTHMDEDSMDNVEENIGSPVNDTQNDFINSLESSIGWDAWKDELAMSMWNMNN
ncbi:uncharacterized protein [Primulina eburnea]|uniref:uncharacterized protein n=1 Tax=Primulina eburnea TaxID=1245227 RepID=UPI003C6C7E8D